MAKTLLVDTESQVSGTSLTTGNSAFNALVGPLVFDNAQAMHGAESIKVGPSAGSGAYGAKTGLSATSISMWGYCYFPSSAPASDYYLCKFLVGSTRVVSLHINAAGKLRLSDSTGTTGVFTATAVIPLDQWFRWEVFMSVGGTSSTGTISFGYYLGDSTTPIQSYSAVGTSNCGTAAITVLNAYMASVSTYANASWADDYGYDPVATGLPGPYSAGVGATVNAVVAVLNLSAPAPAISADTVVSGGGPSNITISAPPPAVTAGAGAGAVPSALAVTARAPAVTGGATVQAVVAVLTVTARAPQSTGGASVAAAAALLNLTAPAPSASAGASASVSVPRSLISTMAPAPTVSGGATVLAKVAVLNITAPAPAPVGVRAALVQAVVAVLSLVAPAPRISSISRNITTNGRTSLRNRSSGTTATRTRGTTSV